MGKKRKPAKPSGPPFPLRAILDRYHLSQRQLSKRTGISEQRITAIVRGRHSPTWRTILRLCTAIGADLGDLAPRDAPRVRRRKDESEAAPGPADQADNGAAAELPTPLAWEDA